MTLNLPTPIDSYFDSEKTDDTDILDKFFSDGAVVFDESHTHRGLVEFKAWKSEGKRKSHYTVEPLSVDRQAERTLVSAKLAGNFPGSPVMLTYAFTLKHDLITQLEIS